MELPALLGLPVHCLKLFYGVAAVGLAGAVALTASGGAAERQRPTTAAFQPMAARDVLPDVTQRPRAFIVLVASDEQTVRVREQLGNVGEYYAVSDVAAPPTFLVVRTPQEAALARKLLAGDPSRLLIDLTPGLALTP